MEATNPTDLNLSFTPPAIQGFDYAGLKTWAEGIKAKYADVVVMEDQVTGTKAEMAELNRIKKQLDASRIAAVKKVSEPIKEFEAQVKEVCGIFQATYDFLGEQVNNYEQRAREQKRTEVLFAIETLTAEAGYPGLAIPVQDSWLNKTQKPKATADAIKALIADHIKAEKDAAALEQAKQDRAVAIEAACADHAIKHNFTVPASQFLRLYALEVPLADALDQISRAYTAKAEAMAKANVAPVVPVSQPAPAAAPAQTQHPMMGMQDGSPATRPTLKNITVALRFDPAREAEVNMALRHLEGLGVSVVRVAGPYETREIVPQQRTARPY